MKLTLGQAARTAKRSKGSISRALNSGTLAGTKLESGRWQIDPAELSRWVEANPSRNRSENRNDTPFEPPGNDGPVKIGMLRDQLDQLAAERDRERDQLLGQIEDLRQRLDGSEAERRQLNAILTDQRHRRGLWERLFG